MASTTQQLTKQLPSGGFARSILQGKDAAQAQMQSILPAKPILAEEEDDEESLDAIEDVLASLVASVGDDTEDQQLPPASAGGSAAAPTLAGGPSNPVLKMLKVPEDAAPMRVRLSESVRRGELNARRALQASLFVDKEVCTRAKGEGHFKIIAAAHILTKKLLAFSDRFAAYLARSRSWAAETRRVSTWSPLANSYVAPQTFFSAL